MDNAALRKLQLTQLEMLKEVKRVCDNNGIAYFLDSGTLLGAVRHGGFIPWDDDLDVGMLRSEYDKFIECAKRDLKDEYFLQTWETDPGYPMPYAKIRKKNTYYGEKSFEKADINQGIFIDIFPYDVWPAKRKRAFFNRISRLRALLVAKCKYMRVRSDKFYKSVIKFFIVTVVRFFSLFTTKEKLIRKYEKLVLRTNAAESDELFEETLHYKFGYWVLPKSVFRGYASMKFEDEEFSVPSGYDEYLTAVYGDYMTLPPEDKRGGHNVARVIFDTEKGE